MRLALDAMGGDHAPAATVEGALLYVRKFSQEEVVLVGDQAVIERELSRHRTPRLGEFGKRLTVQHAPESIGMDEHPGQAVRRKKRSSINVCFEQLKKGLADAVVSAGNSGAVMAGALFSLGRLAHVDRPALLTVLPSVKRGAFTVLLDCGANVVCRPLHLVQFAHLGEVYARRVLGRARPSVGLLANGEEDSKGTDLTRETLAALRRSGLDFKGYVEGKDLFAGEVDVIVTDGFTGNVALKTSEGAAAALGAMLKREIEANTSARIGALLMAPAFAAFRKIVDYAEYGGAPLIGVDGVAVIAHGRSSPKAIKNALRAASRAASLELEEELSEAAKKAAALLVDERAPRAESEATRQP